HTPSVSALLALCCGVPPVPPSSPLFPYRRSSDLADAVAAAEHADAVDLDDAVGRKEIDDVVPHLAVDVIAVGVLQVRDGVLVVQDRKSTRLNSSHVKISYAVFCLKKKNGVIHRQQ